MSQLSLFDQPPKKIARTYSDTGLYNGAVIALNSGGSVEELQRIVKRKYAKGEMSQDDYNAALSAIEKAAKRKASGKELELLKPAGRGID